jgi:hypothetical protein
LKKITQEMYVIVIQENLREGILGKVQNNISAHNVQNPSLVAISPPHAKTLSPAISSATAQFC